MKKVKSASAAYSLDPQGSFVVEDYNRRNPFCNFFPGIAGLWGIPMWVFYVNRGQCISSFGIQNKDKAMLEFQPANKAYRLTSTQGFRTFLKITGGGKTLFWEPFQSSSAAVSQRMRMSSYDLTIEDEHPSLGIAVKVRYFTIAEETFPALVREVSVTNRSRKNLAIELVDGLPVYMPYGMNDWAMKNMSRTVEAWVKVKNVKNRAPFYHLNVDIADSSVVKHITEGNFYFCFEKGKTPRLLDPVVDPAVVFGAATDFLSPQAFHLPAKFSVPPIQQTSNRTPSAMSFLRFTLAPGRSKELAALAGYTHSLEELGNIVKKTVRPGFLAKKLDDLRDVTTEIKQYAFTHSSSNAYDLYCGQTFLDNVMRGGLPISLKTGEGTVSFNVYSRKHGDPERDYNYFVVAPAFFSQGNGNYRDVNQNRRNDIWFNSEVKDTSIVNFFSLSQADGYNPLVVKGASFVADDAQDIDTVLKDCVSGTAQAVADRIRDGFQPGDLLNIVLHKKIPLKVTLQEFLGRVLDICHKVEQAEHGEGFWSDHWTYNLDLVESYLSVYPEKWRSLLLEKNTFTFYHNTHHVVPRDQRYLLTKNGVRQYHSVKDGGPHHRNKDRGHRLCVQNGQGTAYHTNLLSKMLCLVANKAATLDPSGIGIEMEADRPNWYDALNGLPGLLGSSISETFELKRLGEFLLDSIDRLSLKGDEKFLIFVELEEFIRDLSEALKETDTVAGWDKANTAKEYYRGRIRDGIKGEEKEMSVEDIRVFLKRVVSKTQKGIDAARDEKGLMGTYFFHEVTAYEALDRKHGDMPYVVPTAFKRHTLPYFLEGFVHYLRVENDQDKAREFHSAVRKSELFDRKLKMYKVNADLSGESEEIGRTRIFPSGWLENGSIWLHMEYKYILELLRRGLYAEFDAAFRDVLIPFLDPKVYGRSILENSSFLVSSSHEDKSLHGQGYVARLSGSTAEFLHIWLYMNVGQRPFIQDTKGQLAFRFQPVLPGRLFSRKEERVPYLRTGREWEDILFPKNTYAFTLFGKTLVVYHNPRRKDTFGPGACLPRRILLTYADKAQPVEIQGDTVPSPHAKDIRQHKLERIDVHFE